VQHRDERAIAIGFGDAGGALEARYVAGADADSGGAVIAPPHPLYGGSIDSPVVEEIGFGCRQVGLATLCFNWRGVGASSGQPSGAAADADSDYATALEHLIDTVSLPIVACGYSFGAAAAVRASRGRAAVRRLVLVAPPPSLLDRAALEGFGGPVLVVVGDSDPIAPVAELEHVVADLARAELVVAPGADHFFGAGLSTISRAIIGSQATRSR